MGKAPHKGDGTECPLSPPVPPGLRDAPVRRSRAVGIGSRARRDGAKRPLYSDRKRNEL
jgi:hypothetical protein